MARLPKTLVTMSHRERNQVLFEVPIAGPSLPLETLELIVTSGFVDMLRVLVVILYSKFYPSCRLMCID